MSTSVKGLTRGSSENSLRCEIGSTVRASLKVLSRLSDTTSRSSPEIKKTSGRLETRRSSTPGSTISAGVTVASHPPSIAPADQPDRKSTRLNSSHGYNSDAGFCLQKKKNTPYHNYVYYITRLSNSLRLHYLHHAGVLHSNTPIQRVIISPAQIIVAYALEAVDHPY